MGLFDIERADWFRTPIARTTGAETPTRAMVGSERDIVTTGAIVITAAIGADAGGEPVQTLPCVNQKSRGEQASRFNYAIGRCFHRSRAWRPAARQG